MLKSLERTFAVWFADLGETFDIEPEVLARKYPIYFEVLAPLGSDLVELAIRRCIANCKFFPRPVEIKEQVAGELQARADETNRQLAKLSAPVEENDWHWLSPAQRAAVDARLAAFDKAIAATGAQFTRAKPPPAEVEDPEDPRPQYDREQRNRLPPLPELVGWRLVDADDPRVLARLREIGE